MGTDIHTFLEYADTPSGEGFSGDPARPAMLFGKLNIIRDYDPFDALTHLGSRACIAAAGKIEDPGMPMTQDGVVAMPEFSYG